MIFIDVNNSQLEHLIEEKKIPFIIATQKDKMTKKKINIRHIKETS